MLNNQNQPKNRKKIVRGEKKSSQNTSSDAGDSFVPSEELTLLTTADTSNGFLPKLTVSTTCSCPRSVYSEG